MEKYLAFDVGGSYIKYGVVQGNGTVLSRGKSRTNSHLGSEHLLQQLCQIGERAMAREQFNGIAISTTKHPLDDLKNDEITEKREK